MVNDRTVPKSIYEPRWHICDFVFCTSHAELEEAMRKINQYGYDLITATQDATGVYTVFFRRRP